MQISTQSILSAFGFLGFIVAESSYTVPPSLPTVPHVGSTNYPPVSRPKHSQCYNYFFQKDGCVFSAGQERDRCPITKDDPGHKAPEDIPHVFKPHYQRGSLSLASVQAGEHGTKIEVLKSEHSETAAGQPLNVPTNQLVRRYDDPFGSFAIAGGSGICGNYTDDKPGVCVYASEQDSGAASGGWMNGTFTKACGRVVYLKRKGQGPDDPTIYAPVVDGCNFNAKDPQTGCFRIGLTKKTFTDLNPTPDEQARQTLKGLVWDFANSKGDAPHNAAP